MRLWFRRSRGRHALGAAVTALPTAPLAVEVTPAAPPAVPVEPLAIAPSVPAVQLPTAAPSVPAAAALAPTPAVPSSRVQLGFRDGSTASLDPGSEQAVALEELAGRLARRTP